MSAMEVLVASITMVLAIVVLAIVFRVSQEVKEGFFRRFFKFLEIAFLFLVFGRTVVTLDFAYGIETYGFTISDVQLLTAFVVSSLLALAFIVLYFDWSKDAVAGWNS